MKFLVNEQNVSVMYIDINPISGCLDLNIVQQDECFWATLRMEVEYANSNLKTSLSQIWVICQLLPFVSVGQITRTIHINCSSKANRVLRNLRLITNLCETGPKSTHWNVYPHFIQYTHTCNPSQMVTYKLHKRDNWGRCVCISNYASTVVCTTGDIQCRHVLHHLWHAIFT